MATLLGTDDNPTMSHKHEVVTRQKGDARYYMRDDVPNKDSGYVDRSGDTMTGALTIDNIIDVTTGEAGIDTTVFSISASATGLYVGYGTPKGRVEAGVGSIYTRTDGGSGTTLYIKESGTDSSGWTLYTSPDAFGQPGKDGEQGPPGPAGKQGPKGDKGDDGDQGRSVQGPQGDDGSRGEKGDRGEKGPKGDPGNGHGPQGPEGPAGPEGPEGPEGKRGPEGKLGPKGDQGSTGEKGDAGADGAEGARGEKGEQGNDGRQGLKGDDGADGEKGEQGIQGIQGTSGSRGPMGPTGPEGKQGPTGKDGDKGDKGDRGDKGKDGEKGDQGSMGLTGPEGPIGQRGPKGLDGADGKDGTNGKNGTDGVNGTNGTNGKDGVKGADGKDGTDGLDGDDGKDGDDGLDGVDGKDGTNGKDGLDGDDGLDGADFTYDDFTPEQLEGLKGEKGDPFEYGDFTPEQLEALKGDTPSKAEFEASQSVQDDKISDLEDRVEVLENIHDSLPDTPGDHEPIFAEDDPTEYPSEPPEELLAGDQWYQVTDPAFDYDNPDPEGLELYIWTPSEDDADVFEWVLYEKEEDSEDSRGVIPFVSSYRLVMPEDFNDEPGTCYAKADIWEEDPDGPESNYKNRSFIEWGFASRDVNGMPLWNSEFISTSDKTVTMFDYMQSVSNIQDSAQSQFSTFVMEQQRGHSTWLGHVREGHNHLQLQMDELVHIRMPSALEPFDLIRGKVSKSGDNMEGQLNMEGKDGLNKIVNLAEPTKDYDAANKKYVDNSSQELKDHLCAAFFEVLDSYGSVENATTPSMAAGAGFGDNKVKYWVKPPSEGFFKTGESIYINEDGPYKLDDVTGGNKWNTFFITNGPRPTVGTTCTLSKTRKLCTELNHLQNEIVELEEEIEALAPTLERGSWRFNPTGSASPAMFAMYASGTSTSEYPQADQLFINTLDSDGGLHNFNDVEVGSYLEIFSPDDGDYGLYKVTGKSDETGGANSFWMFDVEHSRSNRPMADASLEDKCRIKFFTIAEATDPTAFVMKAGDTMLGDLNMGDKSKIKTLFLDSGQNSNLALQHDGNTKVYVGNTQTSFINHIKLNKDGVDDDHVVTKKYVDDSVRDSSGGSGGDRCISINGGNLCASDAAQSWAEVIRGNPKVAELKVLNHHTDVQPATEPCMCTANFDGDIKYWVKPAKENFFKDGDSIYLKYVTGSSQVEDGPYKIKNVVETNVWNTFFISGGPRPKVGTECSISKTSKFDLSADGDGLRRGTETPEGYDSSGFVFGDYFHYLYSGYDSRKHDARVHCETGEEEIIWTFPYTPNGYSDCRTTINDRGTIYVRARDVMEASSASNQAVIANGRLTEHDRVHDYTQYTFYSNSALASTWIKTCFSKNDTFFGVVRHKKVNDGVENKLVWINYKNDPTRPAKGSFDTVNITSQTDHHRVFRVRDEVYLTCDNLSEIYRFVGTGTSSISKDNWVKTGFRLPLKADGVTYETEIHQIAYLPDLDRYYLGGKHNGYLSQPSKGRVIGGNTFADCVPFGPFVWNYDADEEPLEIWHKHHLPHVSNGCVIQGVPKANYGVGTIFGSGYIIFDGSETYQIEGDPDNTNKFDYDEVQYVPPTSSKFCQNGPPHYYTQEHSNTGATSLFFGNGYYRYSHNNVYPNPQILTWNGVPVLLGGGGEDSREANGKAYSNTLKEKTKSVIKGMKTIASKYRK